MNIRFPPIRQEPTYPKLESTFCGPPRTSPLAQRDGGLVADPAGPRHQKERCPRFLDSWELVAPLGEFGQDEVGSVFGVEGDADGRGAIGERAGENFEALAGFCG